MNDCVLKGKDRKSGCALGTEIHLYREVGEAASHASATSCYTIFHLCDGRISEGSNRWWRTFNIPFDPRRACVLPAPCSAIIQLSSSSAVFCSPRKPIIMPDSPLKRRFTTRSLLGRESPNSHSPKSLAPLDINAANSATDTVVASAADVYKLGCELNELRRECVTAKTPYLLFESKLIGPYKQTRTRTSRKCGTKSSKAHSTAA